MFIFSYFPPKTSSFNFIINFLHIQIKKNPPIDCFFHCADALLEELRAKEGNALPVLVDFHAEATSEKKALALYLDGRVSAVLGTHTHVQTADEQILPGGTAFLSDVGMTGGHGGVIGVTAETVLPRYLTGLPSRFEVCGNRKIGRAHV